MNNNYFSDFCDTPPQPSLEGRVQKYSRILGAVIILPLGEDLGEANNTK